MTSQRGHLLFVLFALAATSMTAWAAGQVRSFVLRTDMSGDGMAFYGPDGAKDPQLSAQVGDLITVTLQDVDGAAHDVVFPDFKAASALVKGMGGSISVSFTVDKPGSFAYFCDVPGHREAGMEGTLVVGGPLAAGGIVCGKPAGTQAEAADVVRDPADLPGPIGDHAPTHVRIELVAQEVVGQLAPGTTFTYWTFNGKVPGPFFRVRVGDTVEVHFRNAPGSMMSHSVDFHAVTGPGGGAVMTNTPPGGESTFTFKALHSGLYVYHCATPMVAEHIANGMYGMILVEPPRGLRKVDREFYVMQGEIYTTGPFGRKGMQETDTERILDERPTYFVFNGAVGGLTEDKPLKARVGETVRIFFGVGGPNCISSFHLIGEIMDRVYDRGTTASAPLREVQTTLVPPGGSMIAEISLEVPGRFTLVDHALSRMQKGLMGWLLVDGVPRPDLYNGVLTPGSGH